MPTARLGEYATVIRDVAAFSTLDWQTRAELMKNLARDRGREEPARPRPAALHPHLGRRQPGRLRPALRQPAGAAVLCDGDAQVLSTAQPAVLQEFDRLLGARTRHAAPCALPTGPGAGAAWRHRECRGSGQRLRCTAFPDAHPDRAMTPSHRAAALDHFALLRHAHERLHARHPGFRRCRTSR